MMVRNPFRAGGLLVLAWTLSQCDKPQLAPRETDASIAASAPPPMSAPPLSAVALPSPSSSLPKPSSSAHFDIVPGTEGWKMVRLRGDANYKGSLTYQACMKAPPHPPNEADFCKQMNDDCVDNRRSQEACDADTKGSLEGLANVKRLTIGVK